MPIDLLAFLRPRLGPGVPAALSSLHSVFAMSAAASARASADASGGFSPGWLQLGAQRYSHSETRIVGYSALLFLHMPAYSVADLEVDFTVFSAAPHSILIASSV